MNQGNNDSLVPPLVTKSESNETPPVKHDSQISSDTASSSNIKLSSSLPSTQGKKNIQKPSQMKTSSSEGSEEHFDSLTPQDHIRLIRTGVHSDYLHFLHILDKDRLECIKTISQWHNFSAKSTILQMKSEMKQYNDQRNAAVKDGQISLLYDNEINQRHLLRSEDAFGFELIADLPLPKGNDPSAVHSFPEIAQICLPSEFETWFLERQINMVKSRNNNQNIQNTNNLQNPAQPNITHNNNPLQSQQPKNMTIADLPMLTPLEFSEEYYTHLNSNNTLRESERFQRTISSQKRGASSKIDVYLDTTTAELVYDSPGDKQLRFSINSRLAVIGADSRKWPGEVIYIDPIEIHVRYDQGDRARIYLDDLRTLRYKLGALRPNPHPEK